MTKKDRPKVGVCLCIMRDGKTLLHKRNGGHSHGAWAFPGGHLEYGESFEEGALRELAEEAGPIAVTNMEFWTAANTVYEKQGKHYVLIIMKADWVEGEAVVMEPDKCQCWDWFDWDDLPSPLLQGNQWLVDHGMSP